MNESYTIYPEEKKMLLFDGLEFHVIEYEMRKDGQNRQIAFYRLNQDSVYKLPAAI